MAQSARQVQHPETVFDNPVTRGARVRLYDKVCFFLVTLGALWLAILLAVTTPSLSWLASVAILPSTLTKKSYPTAPVSPLLLFDRSSPKTTDWTVR